MARWAIVWTCTEWASLGIGTYACAGAYGAFAMKARRLWLCTTLGVEHRPIREQIRNTSSDDDAQIANLLTRAYAGTIDDDPDHSFTTELQTWRGIDGADDETSRVVLSDSGIPTSVCLVGREFGLPLLYEIATDQQVVHTGQATAALFASMRALATAGNEAMIAWVTVGNVPCEQLLTRAGFIAVTEEMRASEAKAFYQALARETPDDVAAWLLDRNG